MKRRYTILDHIEKELYGVFDALDARIPSHTHQNTSASLSYNMLQIADSQEGKDLGARVFNDMRNRGQAANDTRYNLVDAVRTAILDKSFSPLSKYLRGKQ